MSPKESLNQQETLWESYKNIKEGSANQED